MNMTMNMTVNMTRNAPCTLHIFQETRSWQAGERLSMRQSWARRALCWRGCEACLWQEGDAGHVLAARLDGHMHQGRQARREAGRHGTSSLQRARKALITLHHHPASPSIGTSLHPSRSVLRTPTSSTVSRIRFICTPGACCRQHEAEETQARPD